MTKFTAESVAVLLEGIAYQNEKGALRYCCDAYEWRAQLDAIAAAMREQTR